MTATHCHDGNTLGHGHDGHTLTGQGCGRDTHTLANGRCLRHEGTFDPAAWLSAWTANGCGYYLSSSGLGLAWADVLDRHQRNRMLAEVYPPERVAALVEHIESLRYGREQAA